MYSIFLIVDPFILETNFRRSDLPFPKSFMKIEQNSKLKQLYLIEVGDYVLYAHGNNGIVSKVDISKFRNIVQFIFRLREDKKIQVTKRQESYIKEADRLKLKKPSNS